MKNKTVTIPMAMLVKKFYCHRCGAKLERQARSRTVRRGDPDYEKHRDIADVTVFGDIEVTEYDFRCPQCSQPIRFEQQRIIEYIQRRANKHTLSQSEINAMEAEAKAHLDRKRKLTNIVSCVVFALAAIMIFAFLTGCFANNTCPAPDDLESMEVYQFLSQEISSNSTPEEAIEAFAQMCEISIECLDDRILFEALYYEESGIYNIHLARQFQFSNSTEFVQLHLDLSFSAADLSNLPQTSIWYDTKTTDVRTLLFDSDCFHAVANHMPSYTGVSIDWTWW